jgi:hypothetical protein
MNSPVTGNPITGLFITEPIGIQLLMSKQTEELKKIIQDNLHHFAYLEGGYTTIKLPKYDLYPRDYLEFAEHGITNGDTKRLIECVSNLKRATDCQIDIFIYACGMEKYFKKRKLGIDKKLEFLRAIGVFDSRTLSRLNSIRNRMEHRYEIPKIKDIEVYFDLVIAFVSVVESSIIQLNSSERHYGNMTKGPEGWGFYDYPDKSLTTKYDFEKPEVYISYGDGTADKDTNAKLKEENSSLEIYEWSSTPLINYDDFVYYFRVFNLLGQVGAFASEKYIIARL